MIFFHLVIMIFESLQKLWVKIYCLLVLLPSCTKHSLVYQRIQPLQHVYYSCWLMVVFMNVQTTRLHIAMHRWAIVTCRIVGRTTSRVRGNLFRQQHHSTTTKRESVCRKRKATAYTARLSQYNQDVRCTLLSRFSCPQADPFNPIHTGV